MFKPMLAGKAPEDLNEIKYPVLASPKIDGIRCLIVDGEAVSRTLKPIPNRFIAERLRGLPSGLDGEVWVQGARTFGDVSGAVMRASGEPDFVYHVFDHFGHPEDGFSLRLARAQRHTRAEGNGRVSPLRHVYIEDREELLRFEEECLAAGHEGVMLRDPKGAYKHGRSSTKQGGLLKLKRFEDDEAVVVGFEELMHNDNEATRDVFGRTERSSHKANLRPAGVLGKLLCVSMEDYAPWRLAEGKAAEDMEFGIGTGYDSAQRAELWARRGSLPGKLVKYRHQPHGAKDAPRCPVFLGFRHEDDL